MRSDRTTRLVLALCALALVARLALLGSRVAHWDEARVAYWVLKTAETGVFEYRPIIHGPFIQHAGRYTFALFGTSDFALRLPVALVGGLLPAVALLLRTRLSNRETVALAAVLALDPLLVYFGRFFRSDVPLAAFALVALAALVRAHDTGERRWLLLSGTSLGLAVTTKENVVLYLACWAGAGALVAAWQWSRGWRPTVGSLHRWLPAGLAALGLALAVAVAFYAPRGTGLGPLATVEAATLGSGGKLLDLWLSPHLRDHAYPPFLGHYLAVLVAASGATALLAAVGGVVGRRRPAVGFCLLWAGACIVGYPYAADIRAPWLVVHATVALALPAAVGLAWLAGRWRTGALADRRTLAVGAVLLLCGVQVAGANVALSYTGVSETDFVAQGAQPSGEFRTLRDDLPTIAAANDGPDVLFYGRFAVSDEAVTDTPPIPEGEWYNRLPMPWYTERAGATVVNARNLSAFPATPPPVVVADSDRRADLEPRLPGYTAHEEPLLLHGENRTYTVATYEVDVQGESVVVFVRDGSVNHGDTADG